jgi:hypothetical protein
MKTEKEILESIKKIEEQRRNLFPREGENEDLPSIARLMPYDIALHYLYWVIEK